jgi:8-oxo-dGTP pyrophosphatase MutT (NUDIX family)
MNKKQKLYCSNCGKHGHPYKNCKEAITSYGVINILITTDNNQLVETIIDKLSINNDNNDNNNNNNNNNEKKSVEEKLSVSTTGIKYNGPVDMKTFCTYKDNIRFLMIRRKHTLGFLEFIRGRYNVGNVDGIIFLFSQMTSDEIKKISISTMEELWIESWHNNKIKTTYKHEYDESVKKFNKLKNIHDCNNSEDSDTVKLSFYVNNVRPKWNHAEWGFPKGRRNYYESDLMCGIREFQEESGITDGEYVILDKIKPITENLIGTNGINYKHIYYPSISTTNKSPTIIKSNKSQSNEIGDIGWYTYEEAMKLIRPYHTERKKILTELYMYIINNI